MQPAEQVSDKDELLACDTGLATPLKIRDRRKKNFRKTYDTGLVTFMMWVYIIYGKNEIVKYDKYKKLINSIVV